MPWRLRAENPLALPPAVFETRAVGCYAFHGAERAVASSPPLGGVEGLRRRDEESSASGSVAVHGRGLRGVGHGSRTAGREPAAGRGGHGPTLAVGGLATPGGRSR